MEANKAYAWESFPNWIGFSTILCHFAVIKWRFRVISHQISTIIHNTKNEKTEIWSIWCWNLNTWCDFVSYSQKCGNHSFKSYETSHSNESERTTKQQIWPYYRYYNKLLVDFVVFSGMCDDNSVYVYVTMFHVGLTCTHSHSLTLTHATHTVN